MRDTRLENYENSMNERTLPDFLLTPSQIVLDKKLQPLDGYVYGVVYWYSKLRLQRCIASNQEIASLLQASVSGVKNSLVRLKKQGYVEVILDPRTNERKEIIPLIYFSKKEDTEMLPIEPNPVLNSVPPRTQTMTPPYSNESHNNKIKQEDLTISNIYTKILEHWNSKGIIKHTKITDKMKRCINGRVADGNMLPDILTAIDNYAIILEGKEYYWNYKWTLQDFLQRGFEKFQDLEIAKSNYRKGGQLNGEYQNSNRAEKGKYSDIKYEG